MAAPRDPTDRTVPLASGRAGASELTIDSISVVVEGGPDEGRAATLGSTSLRIGGDPTGDLVLTDPTVSRKHLLLTLTPEGILAEDLDSTNGTVLEGTRIRSAYVPDGGVIRLGASALRVRRASGRMIIVARSEARFMGMIGQSQAMRDIFGLVEQLARTDLPVLVTGETGSGKELIGRALHDAGPRRDRRFLVLDCGAIVPDLLRSELFGHEKGAFTGADRTTRGILEESAGGTVFLDEVGEIDPSVQPQLLRALETREVCRLGSRQSLPVDFRIVSATNRDLRRMAQDGRFRPDLFYRLSCVTIRVPPLRERPEDIPLLAASFAKACAERHRVAPPHLDAPALDLLRSHAWPGNVRELKNAVEALTVLSGGRRIGSGEVRKVLSEEGAAATESSRPDAEKLDDVEREAIRRALEATRWNRRAAARRLGISPTTLLDRVRRYGLKPEA
jgi:DNA-binding NtrC family response regulator